MRVWAESLSDEHKWMTLGDLGDEYLPEMWRGAEDAAEKGGHGGSDYVMLTHFLAAVNAERPNPIDVHRAMDMTLPCLISQQSIRDGGIWMDVPNSRDWVESE
jgi:hypothetical protein